MFCMSFIFTHYLKKTAYWINNFFLFFLIIFKIHKNSFLCYNFFMKFPIFSRFISLNLFIYVLLLWGLSFIIVSLIDSVFLIIPIWLLFLGILIILEFFIIPLNLSLIIADLVLCKFKILKYKYVVNVSSKAKYIIYSIVFIISVLYIWNKLYFEPLLEKNLLTD